MFYVCYISLSCWLLLDIFCLSLLAVIILTNCFIVWLIITAVNGRLTLSYTVIIITLLFSSNVHFTSACTVSFLLVVHSFFIIYKISVSILGYNLKRCIKIFLVVISTLHFGLVVAVIVLHNSK